MSTAGGVNGKLMLCKDEHTTITARSVAREVPRLAQASPTVNEPAARFWFEHADMTHVVDMRHRKPRGQGSNRDANYTQR